MKVEIWLQLQSQTSMNNLTDFNLLRQSQYSDMHNLQARWDLYDYAVPTVDLYKEALRSLNLNGSESILEVGCGDGSVLAQLTESGHQGSLVGQDITVDLFKTNQEKYPAVNFLVGSADSLPMMDNSCDVILAFFMLYHLPDPVAALREWHRILKPGGKILISTSSSANRPKHKAFKKQVEEMLGKKAPAQFSSSFNLENGEAMIAGQFTLLETRVYHSQIQLTEPGPYLMSLGSVRDLFVPQPTVEEWQMVENHIQAAIKKEIAISGVFVDSVKRGFFRAQK